MTAPNTLFLRLEGPLQSWGRDSKFVIRRTGEAPTKSGVLGMVCSAMGVGRSDARPVLSRLNSLRMGVRIDRPGTIRPDYHTVGAGIGILRADGLGIKRTATTKQLETLVTRRYYLCDASFLVALQGEPDLILPVHRALANPRWPLFLGRKSCPPAVPVVSGNESEDLGCFPHLIAALRSRPWQPRLSHEVGHSEKQLPCLLEWRPASDTDVAPVDAEVWRDSPVSFDPPAHHPRLLTRESVRVPVASALQRPTPRPPRPRADYGNKEYRKRRAERLDKDHHLCVFCKATLEGRGGTVQHITYRRAGGDEELEDLRSLCRLCHDAVTMLEYGLNMGLDRINPEDPRWRPAILRKRQEIIQFRSLETRRRRLSPEEVE